MGHYFPNTYFLPESRFQVVHVLYTYFVNITEKKNTNIRKFNLNNREGKCVMLHSS